MTDALLCETVERFRAGFKYSRARDDPLGLTDPFDCSSPRAVARSCGRGVYYSSFCFFFKYDRRHLSRRA
ncbi:MAG: hypothetical protein CMI16_06890 [Opitutaceae bacterium]|nr:hypothetical protein [Opitutaceae bacterium]